MYTSAASPRLSGNLTGTLTAAGGPLLFGVRLWTSVCLALFVAFWLELDNPFWAGTSAAIVCQPQLGASLRKGWFRMVGTVVGGISVVVLTACVPQDRIAFLGFLALWGGVCAFAATVFRNFASYAAALAGYTAAIIAADILGAGGGANAAEVFMLAVTRASEISIGIVCAGVVLAGTDFGGAQRRLAASFATLAAEITGGFIRMMELTGPELPDTQPNRRELVRHVIALDPVIDQALGESIHVRHHAPTLQTAVYGLFRALEGWRGAAMHVSRSPDEMDRQGTETILRSIPPELRSARESDSPVRWMADPMALRHVCEMAVRRLVPLPAGTPSLRLLADETAKVLAGMSQLLDGLALLVDAPGRPRPGNRGFRPGVPDWLPALVNAGRAFRRDRCGRAFLDRHRLAERRLNDRVRRDRALAALAKRRSGLRRRHRVHGRHRRCRPLRGDDQICRAPGPPDLPGLLRRHRSCARTGRLCHGPELAACSIGRVHRHGSELYASPGPHKPDELRHGAILQHRAGGHCRVRCGGALIWRPALAVRGGPNASPPRPRSARPAPACRRPALPEIRKLGGPHVWPAAGVAGRRRAAAACTAPRRALRKQRDCTTSSPLPLAWSRPGPRPCAYCRGAGQQHHGEGRACPARPPARLFA